MTTEQMKTEYTQRAADERAGGGGIDINDRIPYVALTMSNGTKYFFQGEEAVDLLDSVPEWIDEEDFILAIAQDW